MKILTTPEEIAQALHWEGVNLEQVRRVHQVYPLIVTEYYLALARSNSPEDPIIRQCIPSIEEITPECQKGGDPDALAEETFSPVPRLVHRYPDRVLFITNSCCATHCRHCLRKRHWAQHIAPPTDGELLAAQAYLREHPEVREVLISGGDPLMLPLEALKRTVDAFASIDSIEMLRIGSRVPVTAPELVTDEIVSVLGNCGKTVWLAAHFNHPWELTEQAAVAVDKLTRGGIPVVNQAVLLKGVNDSAEVLSNLFTGLLRIKVKPYYLFHGDPIEGCMHFRTGIDAGLKIMDAIRGHISGMAIPAFAFDLPGGHGKIRLEAPSRVSTKPDIFKDYQGVPVEYL